jgi:Kef-type K+ transport system membrane component KefB
MPEIINTSMPLVVILLILLLSARVMGEIMERFGQPSMIGEVLAGVILGPTLLNIIYPSSEIKVLSDLGVFLLVVVAGMEIDLDQMRKSINLKNIWIAVLSFTIPLLSGLTIGYFFHFNWLITIFLGLCISITALPVSIRILMDLGKLNTDIGQKIITTAVFNDVLSLLILGIILDVRNNWGSFTEMSWSIGFSLLKITVFLIILFIVYKLFKRAKEKVSFINKQFDVFLMLLKGKESLFAVIMLFILIFASITELAGLHFVVGAFFAAIFLSKDLLGSRNYYQVHGNTNGITMGFLAPIFFAGIGLQFDIHSITNLWLLVIVLLASFISKILGGYLGGRLAGLNKPESVTLGVGLNARGIMELVIANIALSNGIINLSMFSILVVMGLFTTLMSPILLKKSFATIDKN